MHAPPDGLVPNGAEADALADKVAALRLPACYPEPVTRVEVVETHMSWVFLTERHAWKMKKPVRYPPLYFRTLAARRFFCEEELRLNRRLAPVVYLAVVPLARTAGGALRIGGDGPAVEWLVKMRRLPSDRLLDTMLARGAARPPHMQAIARRMAAFHGGQPPAALTAADYRALLLARLALDEHELSDPAWTLPQARVRALCDAQRSFIARHADWLAQRVAAGRVVEGHGDLRPEHVWLGEPLAVIDALEFSAPLRTVDGADEIAFLALECECAHGAGLARTLLQAWRDASGDPAPGALLHFYQACRALQRARLAIAHLREERYRASPKWRRRALRYLALAQRHARQAA